MNLIYDIKYGIRQLIKTPVFTFIAIFSLAIGIGANTVVFNLMNSVKIKSLEVRKPDELVMFKWESLSSKALWHRNSYVSRNHDKEFCSDAFRYNDYCYMRDNIESATDVMAMGRLYGLHVNNNGNLGKAEGMLVSGNFFNDMGITAVIGRLINEKDDSPQGQLVTVLSYKCWNDSFGGDPAIIGSDVILEDACLKIIGVLPESFIGVYPGSRIDYFVPASAEKSVSPGYIYGYEVMARANTGKDLLEIRTEADMLMNRLVKSRMHIEQENPVQIFVDRCSSGCVRYSNNLARPLPMLVSLVAVVLLLACVNLAGLLLARGIIRQHEFAVRQAFGAVRFDLIKQLLVEVALLSFSGALLGLLLSSMCKTVLAKMVWHQGIALNQPNDWRVVLFTLLTALITMLIFGLLPAVWSTRAALFSGLKNKFSDGVAHVRLGWVLVVVQVGLSFFLLTGAVLLVQTLANLNSIDVGYNTKNVLTFELNPKAVGYQGKEIMDFHSRAITDFAAIPGVKSVSCSQTNLLGYRVNSIGTRGVVLPGSNEPVDFSYKFITAEGSFLSNMQIPVISGRDFDESDSLPDAFTVIINRTLAKRLYGDADPVGGPFIPQTKYLVIGVCEDFKAAHIKEQFDSYAIYNVYQRTSDISGLYYQLRTDGEPENVISAVRHTVAGIDSDVYVSSIQTQEDVFSGHTRRERMFTGFVCGFAGMALMLSCIGLYGILSFQISRRRREIGIRMAMGATCKGILYTYLRKTTIMAVCGFILGLPAVYVGRDIISSYLWGVQFFNPAALITSVVILYIVLLLSAYIPARRASSIDPMEALRYE